MKRLLLVILWATLASAQFQQAELTVPGADNLTGRVISVGGNIMATAMNSGRNS